jgi:hypothetical protein
MTNLDQYYPVPFDGEMDPREIAVRAVYFLPSLSLWTPQQMETLDDFTDAVGGDHFLKESMFLIPSGSQTALVGIPRVFISTTIPNESPVFLSGSVCRIGPNTWLYERQLTERESVETPEYMGKGWTCSWSYLIHLIYKMNIMNIALSNIPNMASNILLYQCEYNTGTDRDCKVIHRKLNAVDKFRKAYLNKKFRRGVVDQLHTLPPRGNFSGGQLYRQAQNEFESISGSGSNRGRNYRHPELDLTEEKTSGPSRRAPVQGSLEEDLVLELSGMRD